MSLKQITSPIHKFITHVVSNLYPLLEYAENVILKYIEQFKEEADDLGIQITDVQLRKYIERFDQIKNSPKITDKDLKNYTLSQLMKIVTEGVSSDEEEKTMSKKAFKQKIKEMIIAELSLAEGEEEH